MDRGDRWRRIRAVLWEEGSLHYEKDRWRFRIVGRLADASMILLEVTVPVLHLNRLHLGSDRVHFWELRAYQFTPSLVRLISREENWEYFRARLSIGAKLAGERGDGQIQVEREDRVLPDGHKAVVLLPAIRQWIVKIRQVTDFVSEYHMGASYDN